MHSRTHYLGAALLFLGWVTLFSATAAPQQGNAPTQNTQTGTAPSDAEDYVIETEVQVVTVPVTVTDKKGKFVTDLDKSNFTVLDNGERQSIANLELSSEPLSLAILVETSSRVQTLLPDLRAAGILITQLILGETGEAAVLTFDGEVKIAQDFTQNADQIEGTIHKLSAGTSAVRLSDAVARAVFLLQRRPEGRRKVIIAISEARDQGSSYSLGNALRGAQQSGISVYTVGLSTMKALLQKSPEQSTSSPYPPGVVVRPTPGGGLPTPDAQANFGSANVNLLEVITDLVTYAKGLVVGNPLAVYAAGTGAADFPSDNKAKLEAALGKIGEELRNQYLLTYRPNNLGDPGFHSIQVQVSRRDVEARFRPGYVFVPPLRQRSSPPPAPSTVAPPDSPPSGR